MNTNENGNPEVNPEDIPNIDMPTLDMELYFAIKCVDMRDRGTLVWLNLLLTEKLKRCP
jgi:hypothetical protein